MKLFRFILFAPVSTQRIGWPCFKICIVLRAKYDSVSKSYPVKECRDIIEHPKPISRIHRLIFIQLERLSTYQTSSCQTSTCREMRNFLPPFPCVHDTSIAHRSRIPLNKLVLFQERQPHSPRISAIWNFDQLIG